MIQVRNIGHLKFGQSQAAIAILKAMIEKLPDIPCTILADISGRDFTVVMEADYESLSAWEAVRQKGYATPELMELARQFSELVETTYTELYTIEYRRA